MRGREEGEREREVIKKTKIKEVSKTECDHVKCAKKEIIGL